MGILLWFLIGKMHERMEYIGQIDPKSRYRCRFTISPDWSEQAYSGHKEKNDIDLNLFTARPPSPIQKWVQTYLYHSPNPVKMLLTFQLERQIALESMAATKQGFQFGEQFYLQDGYPELEGFDHDNTLLERHIRIDGYPATFLTAEFLLASQPRKPAYRATILLVYRSDGGMLYKVAGFAEPSDYESVQREMEAITSSFHVEKVPVPSGSKR